MKAEKLNVFIESVMAFYSQIGSELKGISTPYLNENAQPLGYDFSGIISISGPFTGCVYVSAPSIMLREMLKVMGEPDISINNLKDLVGEVANTVSGNARTEFGPDFIISPPVIVEGIPGTNYLPKNKRSYIIPYHWHGKDALIGICLN
ncbi:chemotaxis protein CheX [Psychrobacter sp. I-STPA10]|uniref:chemotaxis protein CheX n=1 Tax=Psychrobacter sp. I-STPA10 TaxID=2585769 RepID=UPI001E3174F0|nr:chemotaxis protein CheX [Psychrobacter sp. I-STPA10]